MNAFDAAVISVVIVLALLGFRAGLLRSLAVLDSLSRRRSPYR
jgi:uncharacterized membrane protein required for colicin V production